MICWYEMWNVMLPTSKIRQFRGLCVKSLSWWKSVKVPHCMAIRRLGSYTDKIRSATFTKWNWSSRDFSATAILSLDNCMCEQMRRLPVEMFDVFGALGFINLCLNPLIYAARYDMFKKSVRRMLMIRRENIVSTIGPGTIWCVNFARTIVCYVVWISSSTVHL